MKKRFENFILIIGLLVILSSFAMAQTVESPTLRGADAIEKLKQDGSYDSLAEAVKARRKKDKETETPTDDAIGQSRRLNGSDSTVSDQFGSSIAISGDTAVIGAFGDDIGANTSQGSVYVFVRSGTVWTEQAKLIASDGATSDDFGASVAISDNTVAVGASGDTVGTNAGQGSVYIFVRSGTVWTQQQKLTSSDGAANDQFGANVGVSNDTVVVGSLDSDPGGNLNQGAAYVFTRTGTVWTQQAKLVASDGAAGDGFGGSIGVSSDTAIIGASNDDVGANASQGSAYIFVRSGTIWTQQQKLTASDGAADDRFGISTRISGETVAVGAFGDDIGANASQGSAYVFVRSGTVWSEQAKLVASDGAASDNFGTSVSISVNTIVIGAYQDDIGANNNQGSAYIFTRSGTVWTVQAKLIASDGAVSDGFGRRVGVWGDTVIVGAQLDDVGANSNQGSAYVFRTLSNTWIQESRKVASDGAANDNFGISVAISGDTAIVGAYQDDVGANTNQGSAYIFVRSGSSWIEQANLTASDGEASDSFGTSVAIYGDTAVVGASSDNVGANADQGSVYVFVRSGTVWTQQAQLTAADGALDEFFGRSVAISGNTVVVGVQSDDVGANTNQGSAYVFTRSGTTWTQQVQLVASNGAAFNLFGADVSISGNTIVVGAYNTLSGSAYVYTRSGTVWSEQAILVASDGASGDNFGISVGISDETIVVGAYFDDVGANTNQGSAYIFVRSGTVWTEQAKLTASDGQANDRFGGSVAISGETVVAGAPLDFVNALNQGSAYLFVRSGTTWTQQTKLTAPDGAASDNFGSSVGVSGDKIIVGAPNSDASTSSPLTNGNLSPTATNQGAVYIFVNDLAPTAANVSISGRVMTNTGAGVQNAVVNLTKPTGEVVSVRTGTFGFYRFDDLTAGGTYVLTVASKRFSFTPQIVQASEDITNLNFIAVE
jgi:hypothetical protein